MLVIKNLHARIAEDGTEIIRGLNLTIQDGEVAAIMGPNGSGKSTLSYILAGREDYEVTEGEVLYNGENILELDAAERAAKGLFLAFQYPVEIPGVATMQFLKVAINEQRKARGEEEMTSGEFLKAIREKARELQIDAEMLKRPVNVGFSGGEKKRNEILQMAMLAPRMCIMDETDSGLDVDAMRLVADGVNALRSPDRSLHRSFHRLGRRTRRRAGVPIEAFSIGIESSPPSSASITPPERGMAVTQAWCSDL
jgi:Fe-S cluster assembly ATP-binding protein